MGYGDEIMVTGRARAARETDPRKVVIIDLKGLPRGLDPRRWKEREIFELCPHIELLPREPIPNPDDYIVILDAGHARPYVDEDAMQANFKRLFPGKPYSTKNLRDPRFPWIFNMDHRAIPGDLSKLERQRYRGDIVIQPYIKPGSSVNKQWPVERWQQVANVLHAEGYPLTMIGPPGQMPRLQHVDFVATKTFVEGLSYLTGCATAILPDGGVQHALAALGVDLPSVVIFGGYSHPRSLGYDCHINFGSSLPGTPCGQWVKCPHCVEAMNNIRVEDVCTAAVTLARRKAETG